MNLPTGQRGRLVAVGLLVIVLTLAFKFTLAPLWQRYQELTPALAAQQQQLQRYRTLAARAPGLEKQRAALLTEQDVDDYLLPGANNALAAASLQQRIQTLTRDLDGRVLSSRVLKPETEDDFERVRLNARLQINLEGLQRLLYGLETHTPYLYVQNLNIRSQAGKRASFGDKLEVQMDIYGLRVPGEAGDG